MQQSQCSVRCICLGNLSWLKSSSHSAVSEDKTTVLDAGDDDAGGAVVMVNGALVNISSILQNLRKSEEEHAQMENELKNREQECGMYCLCLHSSVTLSHV